MPKAPKSVPVTPFEGDQDKWDAFVTQIKLKIVEYPFYFTTDRLKVIYMLQWMQGRTMAWASSNTRNRHRLDLEAPSRVKLRFVCQIKLSTIPHIDEQRQP